MIQTEDNTTVSKNLYSDDALIKSAPGFTNHYATVNGVRLHYVEGGSGSIQVNKKSNKTNEKSNLSSRCYW